MQNFEMIVSDLDGTLLGSDMNLSEKNRIAIEKLCDMGIEFVPSSGRTLYQIPSEIRENPNFRYIIYSNGTAIHDVKAGKDIVCASASILAYTVAQFVMEAEHQGDLESAEIRMDSGDTLISCEPTEDISLGMQNMFQFAKMGYALLQHNYPQYVRLQP